LISNLNESDKATERIHLPSRPIVSTAGVVVSDTCSNENVAGSIHWNYTDEETNVASVGLPELSSRLSEIDSLSEDSLSDSESSDRRVPQSCVTMEHALDEHFIEE